MTDGTPSRRLSQLLDKLEAAGWSADAMEAALTAKWLTDEERQIIEGAAHLGEMRNTALAAAPD